MHVDIKQQDEGRHVDKNLHNHRFHHQHDYLLQYYLLNDVLLHLYQQVMVEYYTKEGLEINDSKRKKNISKLT
jgi:hypothetical protein